MSRSNFRDIQRDIYAELAGHFGTLAGQGGTSSSEGLSDTLNIRGTFCDVPQSNFPHKRVPTIDELSCLQGFEGAAPRFASSIFGGAV
jgi:hypothetical protein